MKPEGPLPAVVAAMSRLLVALLLLAVALAGCSDAGRESPEPPAESAAAPVAIPALGSGPMPEAARPLPREAPAAAPPSAIDPLLEGPLSWEVRDFELEPRLVDGNSQPSPYVVVPKGNVHLPAAGGPFPVLVVMHGRHGTCEIAGTLERLGTPCPDAPPAVEPVDSYRGYDYVGANLASHGYIVASISANDVNDRDNDFGMVSDDYGATARARILLSFLDDLRAVQDGGGPEPLRFLAGKLDLTRVGLMGHSRGGEGVARAAVLNAERSEPHALAAVFALAPTDFDRHLVLGVPLAVLLPYCDGDVSNLQGAWMYDDAAANGAAGPLHQFLAMGANHNWYNTVWTGSDWGNRGDPHCDLDDKKSGRDDPEGQRAHGLAILAAFFRHYVGGEAGAFPLLTGEVSFAQPGVVVTYQPPKAERMDLDDARMDGFDEVDGCTAPDCPIERTYGTARQTYVEWTGGAGRLEFAVAITDASRFERLSLRVGLTHEGDDKPVGLVGILEDAEGRVASVPLQGGVFHPPGDDGGKTTLNTAWAPLAAFTGVDTSRLVWVRVGFLGEGAAQVAEPQLQDLR